MRWPIPLAALLGVLALVGVAIVAAQDDDPKLVIYNGRSHYGDEAVFEAFTEATGIEVELRGGTGPELFERLRSEGDDTPADVLITTDLANLWRAEEAGLLRAVDTPALRASVPEDLHDPDDHWWALTTRLRVPVISTARVDPATVTSYDSLGDPQFKGRTCLRTSANEYNQSLVADMIAKRGEAATRTLLESWMANDPDIINSDGELLAAIAAGECDLGLTNHYYLGRALLEDDEFPVAPAWPDQDGAGAHANLSGAGVVTSTDRLDDAIALLEFLTSVEGQQYFTVGSEFPANPEVAPDEHIASWADVKRDAIAVNEAGPLLEPATKLMLDVGWD
ncbi:MAG: extracellular solute-binding protein [Actinomycetota bacterium]|nr:extracellular solute-binding protein [Actinomycetota bacterium]